MAHEVSEMLERFSERMSTVACDLKDRFIAIAGERAWSETREAWLARTARKCGITYRQAKSIFYNEMREPKASLVACIRAAEEKLGRQKAETARFERESTDGEYRHIVEEIKRAHAKIEALHAQIKALSMRD